MRYWHIEVPYLGAKEKKVMRWIIQHSQHGWRRQVLLALGIVLGLTLMAIIRAGWGGSDCPDCVRQAAWQKVAPHLSSAERASVDAADKYKERVEEFFAERKRGARPFAEEVISWYGRWRFMKGKLPWVNEAEYGSFLRQAFEQHLFKEEDLSELIKGVVEAYASELAGIENQTLLAIRADLSDSALAERSLLPALRNDEAFRQSFADMIQEVFPLVSRDVAITAGRETASFVAMNIATDIAMEIVATVSTQLGVEAGILSTGVGSGMATLGVGLVAGILADMALDWIMRHTGYDPASEIAARVCETLDGVENLLLNGNRDTGNGGLIRELAKLQELRSSVCRESLKKRILEGGMQ